MTNQYMEMIQVNSISVREASEVLGISFPYVHNLIRDGKLSFDHAISCGTEDRVAPVCMSGAGNRIPGEAIPLFAGKRVRIFIHADKAGEKAWNTWRAQLRGTATEVTGLDFGGYTMAPDESVVTDLNDLLRISPDCLERNREEVDNIMIF